MVGTDSGRPVSPRAVAAPPKRASAFLLGWECIIRTPLLTRRNGSETSTVHLSSTMGQQLNKYIKRKRRAAYLKRKKARVKAAKKK